MRNLCLDCGSPLGPKATKCRCGWKIEDKPAAVAHVSCSYDGCFKGANVRVWTRTGWANVCPLHYETVERVPRVSNNPTVQKIREAHQRRRATLERLEKEAA